MRSTGHEEDVIETAIGEVIPGAPYPAPQDRSRTISLQQAPVNHKYILLPEDWHRAFRREVKLLFSMQPAIMRKIPDPMSNF